MLELETNACASDFEKTVDAERKPVAHRATPAETAGIAVYYINLDRAADRRDFMQRTLSDASVLGQRIAAVDGSRLTLEERQIIDPSARQRRGDRLLTNNEIACFLSHRLAWSAIAEAPEPFGVVLEDDVSICPDFRSRLLAIDQDWLISCGLIRLYGTRPRPLIPLRTFEGGVGLGALLSGTCGSQAYVLSAQAAKYLLQLSASIEDPIDVFLDKPWGTGLVTYAISPYPVAPQSETADQSTIGQERQELQNAVLQAATWRHKLAKRRRRFQKSSNKFLWALLVLTVALRLRSNGPAKSLQVYGPARTKRAAVGRQEVERHTER